MKIKKQITKVATADSDIFNNEDIVKYIKDCNALIHTVLRRTRSLEIKNIELQRKHKKLLASVEKFAPTQELYYQKSDHEMIKIMPEVIEK